MDKSKKCHVVSQGASKSLQEIAVECVYCSQQKMNLTFHLKDNNGKLLVKRIIITPLDAVSNHQCPHSKP